MIDLSIPISDIKGLHEPAVVKLVSYGSNESETDIIILERILTSADKQVWTNPKLKIVVEIKKQLDVENGEIWIVFPESKQINRFFRPSANANTLMFTERCDQYCIMCSQPPKNKDYPFWDLFHQAILSLPQNSFLGISGGEPLLEKALLFDLLEKCIASRPDIQFHILTNGQHFKREDVEALKSINPNILWGIPLYSSEPSIHDKVVGKEGAFEILLDNILNLYLSGGKIELRTVLLQQNVAYLSHTANFIADKLPWISFWALMQLEPIGFARIDYAEKFYDNSSNFNLIRMALDTARLKGIPSRLYNFPRCTVESSYRDLTNKSISDWKNKYLESCFKCPEKNLCCGFFEWYNPDQGYSKIGEMYL